MDASATTVPRSSFVTSLAWTFIILAGFTTVIAVVQNLMIGMMFPAPEQFEDAMRQSHHGSQTVPPLVIFMFRHFRLLFASFLAMSALTLVASIGLLKRRNWARLVFIGLMVLGVFWNVVGAILPYFVLPSFPQPPDAAPSEFQENFRVMTNIVMGITVVVALVFAGLFAWLARRLLSAEVRREFTAG